MTSFFSSLKKETAPAPAISRFSSRISDKQPDKPLSARGKSPPPSARGSPPVTASIEERMATLRQKNPSGFQQISSPSRKVESQKTDDLEAVTAWQGDMDSIEQAQMQIQNDQMSLLHSQIHILTRELGDLQKHVVHLSTKIEDSLAEHAQTHSANLAELEAKVQGYNDEHNERHAQNSANLETSLQDVLETTHGKLQAELTELRHGGAGSLKDMGKILADVTEQVDKIDEALEKEHALRMAVEEKLDKMCEDLRGELQVAIEESHAALRLELAEVSGNADDIKSAMQEAHTALKQEFEAHKIDNDAMHRQAQDAISAVNDEHHEKHVENAQMMESNVHNLIGGTHAKLQEELRLLKAGGAASVADMQKILTDVTQQVDNLDQALQQEQELRLAVEARVDEMFTSQDRTINDLSKDMQVALRESHAALKVELAEHGKNAADIKAAMEDAQAAMKEETKLAHGSLKSEMQSLAKNNDAMHKRTLDELSRVHDEHTEKHAQNAERLEAGLDNVLGNTHAKLQEELKILKSGGVGSLKDLQKILTDVTKQVDNLDQAMEQEHELRMAVEQKVDSMFSDQEKTISDLRKDMKVALNESHAALKLELADHGKNAEDIRAAMEEANAALKEESKLAHGSLKNELQSLAKNNDAMHKKTQDELRKEMNSIHDEHTEKHAMNAEKLESGLQSVLGNTHAKLQDELKLLKSGGVGSLSDLQKIVTDLTQQVDDIDKAVEQEHQLRMAVEVKLDTMFSDQDKCIGALRKDMKVALKESHSALKLELAEHGKSAADIKAAMEDAQAALKEETQLAHGSLQNEMQSLAKNNDAMHKRTLDELTRVHNEHTEKHAQNAEKLEAGLDDVLGNTHAKLQEELKILKSGGVGSLKDIQNILTDVTKQVDNLDQALEQEHGLRLAVEQKVDSLSSDQEKTISELRKDMKVALHESHSALKLELAEHGKSAVDIKAAMEDAQAALKEETQLAHGSLKNELQSLSKSNDAMHKKTQEELRKEMNSIHEEHTERHAMNAEKLESGLQNVLGNTHAKLQDELKLLKSGGVGSLSELQKIVLDLTQQVDNIDKAVEQEHGLRMAVEQKLDTMFIEQDKNIGALRKDMKVALNESHSALKLELAEHGKNAEEIKAAMEDAHKALKDEATLAHGSLKNELQSLAKNTDSMHQKSQDALRKEMKAIHEEHSERHAQNAEKLESGLQNVLGNTHAKLQEELKLLKSGGVGSLSDVQKILTDVTQQVDNLDKAMQQEHDLRLAVEEKLDKMFSASDKNVGDLRKDMKVALHESHAALKLELAEHGKNAEGIKAAMEEANAALKDEAKLAHGSLKNELQSLSKAHESMHKKTKEELSREMQAIHEHHTQTHAQNAEKLESGLQNVLGNTHAKLQEELKLLKSGGVGSLKDLQKILVDVTQQVDNLDKAVQQEHELRMNVEEKLDGVVNDQKTAVSELRKDMKVALNESHAALKLELAEHGKNATAIQQAMLDAHKALQGETKLSHGSLKNELAALAKGNTSNHKRSMDDVTRNMQAMNNDHNEKHAVTAERLEAGLQSLRSAVFETQQAFKQDRTSREAQERTMMEFFQDARLQREQSEAGFQEQLRLERVAREVHVNQLKDVIAQRQGFTPNVEYTDLLLQERSSRESAHAIIERRLEAFDRSLSVERNERTTELQRLWEVFDGHTHETVSQVPPRPAARSPLPLSPRTSVRSVPYIETIPQSVVVTEALPVAAERMVSYTPGVETAVTPHTLTRSPLSARRMSAEMPVGLTYSGMPANPSPSPSAPLMMSLPTTGSVTSLPAAPSS